MFNIFLTILNFLIYPKIILHDLTFYLFFLNKNLDIFKCEYVSCILINLYIHIL